MEKKIPKDAIERVSYKIGFSHHFSIDPFGRSCGLFLFWNEDINLEIVNYFNYHIHTQICEAVFGRRHLLTGFYGHIEIGRRSESWGLLHKLSLDVDQKWCVIGDFNEITTYDEKFWGCLHP